MTDTKQQLLDLVNATVKEIEEDYSDAIEWLDDQLCIESYSFCARGEFRGSVITCCTGGPHVEVDTARDLVTGYWGGDTFTRSYSDNLGLHEILEESAPVEKK